MVKGFGYSNLIKNKLIKQFLSSIRKSCIFTIGKGIVMWIARVLLKILGFKITTEFPDVQKSILVFAPHTSYWDAAIGKLVMKVWGVPHRLLGKKELFRFPMVIVMRLLGGIPIRGIKGHNSIYDAVNLLNKEDRMHLVICPEGKFAPTDRWNPGFYYMAAKAHVPVVVAFIDYGRKEAGVKGVISDLSDKNKVYHQLADMYRGVTARHPECFLLPKYKDYSIR